MVIKTAVLFKETSPPNKKRASPSFPYPQELMKDALITYLSYNNQGIKPFSGNLTIELSHLNCIIKNNFPNLNGYFPQTPRMPVRVYAQTDQTRMQEHSAIYPCYPLSSCGLSLHANRLAKIYHFWVDTHDIISSDI